MCTMKYHRRAEGLRMCTATDGRAISVVFSVSCLTANGICLQEHIGTYLLLRILVFFIDQLILINSHSNFSKCTITAVNDSKTKMIPQFYGLQKYDDTKRQLHKLNVNARNMDVIKQKSHHLKLNRKGSQINVVQLV